MSYWKHDAQAAVSLTFDDARSTHLDIAAPLLEEHGFRGTFYVTPARGLKERFEDWRRIHLSGHEIGNHSLSHSCTAALWGRETPGCLEKKTLEDMENDIREAHARLSELFPERRSWTFAYPCYQTHVGAGRSRASYVPIVARYFVAARAGTANYGFFNAPGYMDLHALASQPCEDMRGTELVGLVERAARRGHWIVLTFHEIDRGGLGVFRPHFQELIEHLAMHRNRFWTAPVAEIAEWVVSHPAGEGE